MVAEKLPDLDIGEDDANNLREVAVRTRGILVGQKLVDWLQASTKNHDGRLTLATLTLATSSHTGISSPPFPHVLIDYYS